MHFMNDYDIAYARQRFTRASKPNRLALVIVVERLAEWADQNSDGWAYWAAPQRAAQNAIGEIRSSTSQWNGAQERIDITDEELQARVRPIKAFCTRQQRAGHMTADQRELILRSVTE